MAAARRGNHRAFLVLVACDLGYTPHSHTSFLGQRCLCVHTTANCSTQTERHYFWWQVVHMQELVVRDQVLLSALLLLFSLIQLGVKEGSIQAVVSLKQPHIKLFKLGSSLLFVFSHQAIVRVISWNFSSCPLWSVCQNLDFEECDCQAFLDVLPSLSLITDETKKFRLYHGMFLFILRMLKGHSSFAGLLELRSPFCRCLLIAVLPRHAPYFRSFSR